MTVFKPALQGENLTLSCALQVEVVFIKAHAILFSGSLLTEYNALVSQLSSGLLDHYIGKITVKFKVQGVFAAVINIAALFKYRVLKSNSFTQSILQVAFDKFKVSCKLIESCIPATMNKKQVVIDNSSNQSSVFDKRVSAPADLTPNELQKSEEAVTQGSHIMCVTLAVALQ